VQVATCTVEAPAFRARVDARSVETITDVDAFARLGAEWNDAVDRAGVPHPFLRHEWLLTWWECFGTGCRLHIVIVRSGGAITGIAPLLSETARMCAVPVRRLRLMHNDHTPRADFIITGSEEDAYRAIWTALRHDASTWDVLQLGQLSADSRTHEWMTRLARAEGCTAGIWRSSDSPYLPIAGTWDGFEHGLSGKFRQNLRNRLARLRRIGEPALEMLGDGPLLETAVADSIRLEESGWKRNAGTAIVSDPAVHRFYRSLAPRAAANGWLRLMFLTVGGQRIATSYAFAYDRRLFLCKTGYDPAHDTCAPFKLLTYFGLRDAFARGFVELDFLGDTEAWKREWTTASRAHDWLYIFSHTTRGRLLQPLKFQVVPAVRSAKAFAVQRLQRVRSAKAPTERRV
jgi:CelD/BcsL family acetyltransferase involved in cellulose biosynthesis